MITLTLFNLDDFIEILKSNYDLFKIAHGVIGVHTTYSYLNHIHRFEVYATAYIKNAYNENVILRYQHAAINRLFDEEARKEAEEKSEELKKLLEEKLSDSTVGFVIKDGLWHDSNDNLLRRL